MESFAKVNMSLDEIIRKSRSRSRSTYSSQQWRLERGKQQQLKENLPQRLRSRSQLSYRSGSQIPSQCSVPCVPPRSSSLPRQTKSCCSWRPASAQNFRFQNGLRANIRKNSLDFSKCSASVLRPASSLHQLRLAKKRVEVAKKILNARHQLYLKQLRQYKHEIYENSFLMAQYRLKNTPEFPVLFSEIRESNMVPHHHRGRQQLHTNSYSQGTLSVTFENELANSWSDICAAENVAIPMGFRPSEALNTPPQMFNGCTIRNPSAGKVTNNGGLYMSPQENVRKSVSVDSLPTLVSSLDFPRLMNIPSESNVDEKRIVHPSKPVQTLNQRFSAYRVVCL